MSEKKTEKESKQAEKAKKPHKKNGSFFKQYKSEIGFGTLFALLIIFMGLQGGYQSNWGKVDVREVHIRSYDGRMLEGKLYTPIEANAENPLPGVLAIHGYNNDKDVQRPHSMELAKRGVVVLAIDCLHHGGSDKGDAVFAGSSVPHEAYEWLQNQTFVNSNKTGVVGHSMGAFFAQAVALKYPQIDVLGYQAFGPDYMYPAVGALASYGTNFIQISSEMEEFGGREWNETIEEWTQHCKNFISLNTQATGVNDSTAEFYKTYGDIETGNAQRYVFLPKTHPGQTHDLNATKEITAYFLQTLTDISREEAVQSVETTTYIQADFFGAASAVILLLSLIPLLSLLLKTPLFKEVKQPMPKIREATEPNPKLWWGFATLNWILGGVVYMLSTNAPNSIDSWWLDSNIIAETTPSFDLGIANGYLAFFVVNGFIMIVFMALWYYAQGKKAGVNTLDLGLYNPNQSKKKNGIIIGKTILLAGVLYFYMYVITAFGEWLWTIEIRGPWPVLGEFTEARARRFWLYFWGFFFFMFLNAGIWLFGLMRQKEYGSESKTVLIWWLKVLYAMLLGLGLLNIIGYAPMWSGATGPYLQQIEGGFAPMNLLQLWQFIPFASLLFLIAVVYFRKTGRVYLGSIMLAVIGTWSLVVGTVMGAGI